MRLFDRQLRRIFQITLMTAVLLMGVVVQPALADGKVGVVLLHGKWSVWVKAISSLVDRLEAAGYLVSTPEMPWSSRRMYDASYDDAMLEIDRAVQGLRDKGAVRIVIGGHSLGANAALGYGARRTDLLAVMAIAPGHTPEVPEMRERSVDAVARARGMVAAGQGDETLSYLDYNQGKNRLVSSSAKAFLSYQDPEGPAVMPVNAAKLTAPLLWVVGTEDRIYQRGQAYAFDGAPANPHNRFLVVHADHMETPSVAAGDIVAWLNEVAAE